MHISQVTQAAADKRIRRLRCDCARKQSALYHASQRSAKYANTDTSAQHLYGVSVQQPHMSLTELNTFCDEYFERETDVSSLEATKVERKTRNQTDDQLWYHHRCLRLIALKFGMVAKRRPTIPVA